jgi:hypothetical protein
MPFHIPIVIEIMSNRQKAMKELKQHRVKAQSRMKRYADLKRSERHFAVGDWVYLKLQPYRQVTAKGKKGNHKLNFKFYGPFEVISKVGRVAYHLNLPNGSLIHPMFYVFQLKKKVRSTVKIHSKLPLIGPEGKLQIWSEAILKRRIVMRDNVVAVEVLIQWANLLVEEISWEEYDKLVQQFSNVCLEDKTKIEGEVLSALILSGSVNSGLVTVELEFDLVMRKEKIGDGWIEDNKLLGQNEEASVEAQYHIALELNGEKLSDNNGEKAEEVGCNARSR